MTYFDIIDGLYPDWHARASCNGMTPEIWFPTTMGLAGQFTREDAAAQAKAICGKCPVRRECNESRIRHNEQYGIWAGVDLEAKKKADDAA